MIFYRFLLQGLQIRTLRVQRIWPQVTWMVNFINFITKNCPPEAWFIMVKTYGESCHFMAEQFRIILIYPGDCGMMEYGLVLFDQKRGENSVFCELEMFLFCLEY